MAKRSCAVRTFLEPDAVVVQQSRLLTVMRPAVFNPLNAALLVLYKPNVQPTKHLQTSTNVQVLRSTADPAVPVQTLQIGDCVGYTRELAYLLPQWQGSENTPSAKTNHSVEHQSNSLFDAR